MCLSIQRGANDCGRSTPPEDASPVNQPSIDSLISPVATLTTDRIDPGRALRPLASLGQLSPPGTQPDQPDAARLQLPAQGPQGSSLTAQDGSGLCQGGANSGALGLARFCMLRIAGGSLAGQPSPGSQSQSVHARIQHTLCTALASTSLLIRSQRLQRTPALKQVARRHCFVLSLITTPSCRVRTHTTLSRLVSPHTPHHSCPLLPPPQLAFPPPLIFLLDPPIYVCFSRHLLPFSTLTTINSPRLECVSQRSDRPRLSGYTIRSHFLAPLTRPPDQHPYHQFICCRCTKCLGDMTATLTTLSTSFSKLTRWLTPTPPTSPPLLHHKLAADDAYGPDGSVRNYCPNCGVYWPNDEVSSPPSSLPRLRPSPQVGQVHGRGKRCGSLVCMDWTAQPV